MANRSCPLCFVKLPRAAVLVHSDELICGSCHSEWELSRPSRTLAALIGVIAAYAIAQFVTVAVPKASWFLAVIGAVLAYSFASAIYLWLASDLVIRSKPSPSAFPQTHGVTVRRYY